MGNIRFVKLKEADNVAVAVDEIKAGTVIMEGVRASCDIPQAHKIVLCDIEKGGEIIRYGVVLGYAKVGIKKGDWINEFMLDLPTRPDLDEMRFGVNLVKELPEPLVKTWEGYRNPDGGYAGTRNILGISTTVQCVTGVLNVAVEKMKRELLPKYPNVDDIVPVNHAYGCGVAINAPEAGKQKGRIAMKIVCAIDSMKGSMTSMEAGHAAAAGIARVFPDADVHILPLADGGEGTTDALLEGLGGTREMLTVTGPLGHAVTAVYGRLPDCRTAVMEMAAAAGIVLVKEEEKNPYEATTYGVGEMIRDAVTKGCREFIVGIGGSATNDGGMGMLKALGYRFYEKDGTEIKTTGAKVLGRAASVDASGVLPELAECRFKIACDVTNPLCGKNGATYVFGRQKGVKESEMESLDRDMASFARMSAAFLGRDVSGMPGTGAAGGMGFAFSGYLDAELVPGIELILKVVGMDETVRDCDIVITGEGMLDFQTSMGKVPVGVAKLAKRYGKTVLAFAGGVTKEAGACNDAGIDAFFPIVRGVSTLEQAMDKDNAKANMADSVEQAFRLIRQIRCGEKGV